LLVNNLNPSLHCKLFLAFAGNELTGGLLILFNNKFIHSHLSASNDLYLDYYPNHALVDYVVKWASENKQQIYHLGGGYKGNDNLFYFKSSFGSCILDFYIGKKIHHKIAYDKLVQLHGTVNNKNFFPLYRA
jgi:lipid II:glycine glycyltransferase (peptidoglycan interpeptide bridge formation enzyme)